MRLLSDVWISILWLTRFGCVVAADYKNEAEVGEALKEAFDSGLVKREDLFITTKVSFTLIPVHFFVCDLCR